MIFISPQKVAVTVVQSARPYDLKADALSEALTNHSFVVIVYNHIREVGSGIGTLEEAALR